ncbi:hypothetical protein BDR26DRAFT_630399 [Obelidium mucronatum]|nr:hypothetical protein BDR26DRAFT_630399 [Obelidium mucronatum]
MSFWIRFGKPNLTNVSLRKYFTSLSKSALISPWFTLSFSAVLMDQLSATFISNEIIRLYTNGVTKVDWDTLPLENYESKEVTPFPEFARAYASDANAVDNNNEAAAFPLFWSQIFVDGTDPPLSFEKYDRISFEKQRTLFLSDLEKQASEISALETRKKTQDSQLMFLRKQRLDIDSYSPQVETVLDPVTKQEIQITKAAKAAILFEIFGEEDVAVDENVEGLLKRHEISAEVQSKLGGTTIGDVSAIDNDSLIAIGLLGKDRRKLLALSEMLKSKVSEGLFAQDKVKSSIERKIMRLQRESDDLGEKLRTQIAAHTA